MSRGGRRRGPTGTCRTCNRRIALEPDGTVAPHTISVFGFLPGRPCDGEGLFPRGSSEALRREALRIYDAEAAPAFAPPPDVIPF